MARPICYTTGQLYQYKPAAAEKQKYMILGHVWWNVEQTYAYYMAKIDDEGNIGDPAYNWCQGSLVRVDGTDEAGDAEHGDAIAEDDPAMKEEEDAA